MGNLVNITTNGKGSILIMRGLKQITAFLLSICFVVTTLLLPKAVNAGNIPVRETTVDTPEDGNILVKIRGDFSCMAMSDALKRLNEIRLEACKEGVVDPATKKKLTEADYQPLTWDSDLEWIAQTRAAEAAIKISHSRPLDVTNDPSTTFSVTYNGKQSLAENLAWNSSGMKQGIEQWYGEKSDYVDKTGGQTGHYESIISTRYKSVALSAFRYSNGRFPYAIAQEFSFEQGNGVKLNISGTYDQLIEIPFSTIQTNGFKINVNDSILNTDRSKASLSVTFTISDLMGNKSYTADVAKNIEWNSSNPAILTIDQNGNLIPQGIGNTTISATVNGKTISKNVEVVCDHKWDEGKITTEPTYERTGVKTFTCTRCGATKTEKIPAKVRKVDKINITGISKKIAVGKKITLKATVSPSNATNKKVTWKSGNTKIATVNSKGVVTIKKKTGGKTVTITATAKDGSKKKATYKIKVMKGVVKKVAISGKKTVKAGKTLKLKAKVTASKGANKTVQWTSSNEKYAKVSSSGKVTALKAGKGKKVKITAMATDGSGKKKSVTVKIK